jgi:hypothetical protein
VRILPAEFEDFFLDADEVEKAFVPGAGAAWGLFHVLDRVQRLDFGQRVTSRVEGAHHQLKLAPTSWTAGHIYDVFKDNYKLAKAQRNEHDRDLDQYEARIAGDLSKPEFVLLQRRVSYQEFRKLKVQLELA